MNNNNHKKMEIRPSKVRMFGRKLPPTTPRPPAPPARKRVNREMKIQFILEGEELQHLLNIIHDNYYDLTGESIDSTRCLSMAKLMPPLVIAKVIEW